MTETSNMTAEAAVSEIAGGIEAVRTHVGAFDAIAAGIAQIEALHPLDVIVGDIQTPKGLARATESRAAWRDPRIRVEKARKEAKAPLLALGKTIDAFAAGLEARLRQGEEHYDRQIKAEEARKAAEKAERERIERARIEAHERRLDAIRAAALTMPPSLPAVAIAGRIAELEQVEVDEAWEEYADRARVAKRLTLQAMRDAHTAAVEREEVAARLEAARAEQARIAAELAEQRRVIAEQEAAIARQRAEIERLRAQQESEAATARAADPPQSQSPANEPADAQAGTQSGPSSEWHGDPPAEPPLAMRLGEICERLEFTVSAAFLSSLGIEPCGTDRRAILYRADEWPAICDAIIAHLQQARFA